MCSALMLRCVHLQAKKTSKGKEKKLQRKEVRSAARWVPFALHDTANVSWLNSAGERQSHSGEDLYQ